MFRRRFLGRTQDFPPDRRRSRWGAGDGGAGEEDTGRCPESVRAAGGVEIVEIQSALDRLLAEKRVFVSEADFQFALAWKIQELHPEATLRLEYIPWECDPGMHVDIVAFIGRRMFAIELKYKTRASSYRVGHEEVRLKDHGAQDTGRYDFVLDLRRLERLADCRAYQVERAWAVLLTNDSGYWRRSSRSGTDSPPVDDEFRLHEGAELVGVRRWKPGAGPGTTAGRQQALELRGSYCIAWRDYQPTAEGKPFRYAVVEVGGAGPH